MTLFSKTRTVLEMIKFEHSVFALPFALTGGLLAVRDSGLGWGELGAKFTWIIVAMVAARSAAMAFNRVADAELDARNPRTKTRAIPAGVVSKSFTWGFIVFWSAVLLWAAYRLNPLCLKLAPVALAVVFGYSFTKRFTSLSHLVLGFALGDRPRRRLDRHPRDARLADLAAHRGRHVLDGGFRHHLFLPGLRFRPRSGSLQPAPARSASGARCWFRACCTWEWSPCWLGWPGSSNSAG